jgi:hypothetical protein
LYRRGVDFSNNEHLEIPPYTLGVRLVNELESFTHIPFKYLTASRKNRYELLAGLLDANGDFDFLVRNKKIAGGITFLARSLGLAAYISEYEECFKVSISGETSLVPTKLVSKKSENVLKTEFKLEILPVDDYFGFTLDKDGLYLLGDFTVTHNTGKTVTAAKMIWTLGVKTLIITPSKSITDMMEDVMSKFFGSGSVEVLSTKTTKLKKPISICNIQSLIKIPASVFKDVDCVIIDEFHHSASETYQEVNLNHLRDVYYRIGLTATPFRNDGADLALEGVLSEVLYEYKVQDAIKEGFLVRPRFEIINLSIRLRQTSYQKIYREGIVENVERNGIIAGIANELKDKKVLILVQHKDHGEILKKMIPLAQFIHGEEKDAVRQKMMGDFKEGGLNCLIGTSVIGEGVDLPCAEVLIMAGGGKARSQIIQNIGRVLRIFKGKSEAVIYDFTDRDGSYLEEHSLERQEIYKEYQVK